MPSDCSIVWLQRDLRLDDQPAFAAAVARGQPVIPVFIHSGAGGNGALGSASAWWLHHSLTALGSQLENIGSRLILRSGETQTVLDQLIQETGATAVYWSRRYEPEHIVREQHLLSKLRQRGLTVARFNSSLLFEPGEVQTRTGTPYQVFTPFWKSVSPRLSAISAQPEIKALRRPATWPASESLTAWQLLPSIPWDGGFYHRWTPGEAGARQRLKQFLKNAVFQYATDRNHPAQTGTSRLSPHLHFGEISPHRIVLELHQQLGVIPDDARIFLSEIGWREFAHHILYHFPQTPQEPLRKVFQRFPWNQNQPSEWRAWTHGQTGYPIVDAGMRELWTTGWMHNRVRMIVGSFLTKDLRISWYEGARWFWDTLVDADLASNTLGWQWVGGCGADAAPYFRIFNPVSQGEKFDATGDYVRRWVPELARLSNPWIHQPWNAPDWELTQAGVRLGETYPAPIVDHAKARVAALAAFQSIKVTDSQCD
ncbi:MAG: deoxyribodipyrimidine photo-lyase [Planctomycetota bacterium]|nr:MAG: deoxyribodipyrimidine photo-lyase [Planctomycetota bacterium]